MNTEKALSEICTQVPVSSVIRHFSARIKKIFFPCKPRHNFIYNCICSQAEQKWWTFFNTCAQMTLTNQSALSFTLECTIISAGSKTIAASFAWLKTGSCFQLWNMTMCSKIILCTNFLQHDQWAPVFPLQFAIIVFFFFQLNAGTSWSAPLICKHERCTGCANTRQQTALCKSVM